MQRYSPESARITSGTDFLMQKKNDAKLLSRVYVDTASKVGSFNFLLNNNNIFGTRTLENSKLKFGDH